MGDYVRWAPPYYEGAEDSARSALFLALNRNKRSIRLNLKEDAGREVLLRLAREHDVLLESFRPGVLDRLGVGYERAARGEPGARLLRDHRLRPGRALPRPLGPRHELPRPHRPARADRRGPRTPAGPGRRPDRRPRRRRADGRVRDPRRAARARPLGRGAARRRLDGRRRAVVAGDGRRALLRRRRRAAARRARARGRARLLPPVPLRRRLGDARRAGAEVLAGVVPRRRARGPDREAVRAPRAPTRTPRSSASSSSARARSGASSPPSTTAASSRCSTSTRRSTPSSSARARWSSSSTSRGPAAGPPARRPGEARAARRAGSTRRGRRSASTPTRSCAPPATADEEIAALLESGAVAGPAAGVQGSFHGMSSERPAQDVGAGRALGRQRRDDQALPARGAAARAGQDLAQHGLLPARVRRADPADQAPPGGALHAAQADQGVMDEDPERARALVELEDRILERAVGARRSAASRPRRSSAATTCRRTSSTVSPSSAC